MLVFAVVLLVCVVVRVGDGHPKGEVSLYIFMPSHLDAFISECLPMLLSVLDHLRYAHLVQPACTHPLPLPSLADEQGPEGAPHGAPRAGVRRRGLLAHHPAQADPRVRDRAALLRQPRRQESLADSVTICGAERMPLPSRRHTAV